MFVVSVVYCQVEVSASGWSLVQRSPIESGVPECDLEWGGPGSLGAVVSQKNRVYVKDLGRYLDEVK